MGYTYYTPTYYSTMQDSITSICKSLLPFSLKKPRLQASDEKALKQQSDNLNWQQNAFHEILNLMGLHKEGLLAEAEVDAFRTRLLETLIASRSPDLEQEYPPILRDKLVFLEDLLLANCITPRDYHTSKRSLLQRRDVNQGVELEGSDVALGVQIQNDCSVEEWSTIDLRDNQSLSAKGKGKGKSKSSSINKLQKGMKHFKDSSASVFGFGSLGKNRHKKSIFDQTDIAKTSLSDDHEKAESIQEAATKRDDENCHPNTFAVPDKSTQNPFRVKSMFSR